MVQGGDWNGGYGDELVQPQRLPSYVDVPSPSPLPRFRSPDREDDHDPSIAQRYITDALANKPYATPGVNTRRDGMGRLLDSERNAPLPYHLQDPGGLQLITVEPITPEQLGEARRLYVATTLDQSWRQHRNTPMEPGRRHFTRPEFEALAAPELEVHADKYLTELQEQQRELLARVEAHNAATQAERDRRQSAALSNAANSNAANQHFYADNYGHALGQDQVSAVREYERRAAERERVAREQLPARAGFSESEQLASTTHAPSATFADSPTADDWAEVARKYHGFAAQTNDPLQAKIYTGLARNATNEARKADEDAALRGVGSPTGSAPPPFQWAGAALNFADAALRTGFQSVAGAVQYQSDAARSAAEHIAVTGAQLGTLPPHQVAAASWLTWGTVLASGSAGVELARAIEEQTRPFRLRGFGANEEQPQSTMPPELPRDGLEKLASFVDFYQQHPSKRAPAFTNPLTGATWSRGDVETELATTLLTLPVGGGIAKVLKGASNPVLRFIGAADESLGALMSLPLKPAEYLARGGESVAGAVARTLADSGLAEIPGAFNAATRSVAHDLGNVGADVVDAIRPAGRFVAKGADDLGLGVLPKIATDLGRTAIGAAGALAATPTSRFVTGAALAAPFATGTAGPQDGTDTATRDIALTIGAGALAWNAILAARGRRFKPPAGAPGVVQPPHAVAANPDIVRLRSSNDVLADVSLRSRTRLRAIPALTREGVGNLPGLGQWLEREFPGLTVPRDDLNRLSAELALNSNVRASAQAWAADSVNGVIGKAFKLDAEGRVLNLKGVVPTPLGDVYAGANSLFTSVLTKEQHAALGEIAAQLDAARQVGHSVGLLPHTLRFDPKLLNTTNVGQAVADRVGAWYGDAIEEWLRQSLKTHGIRLRGESRFLTAAGKLADESGATKLIEGVNAVNNFARGFNATGDLSGLLIQGLVGLVTDPIGWGKAVTTTFRTLGNPASIAAILKQEGREAALKEFVAHGGFWASAGDAVEFRLADVLAKGQYNLLKWSNEMFSSTGNLMRLTLWESQAALAKESRKASPAQLRELATAINHATRYTSRQATALEQALTFAPRWFGSQLGLIEDALTKGGPAGALARRSLGTLVVAGTALTVAANEALGRPTDFDPRSSNFLRIRFADRDISLFGSWDALFRLGTTATTKGPGAAVKAFLETKASPVSSLLQDLGRGRTFDGKPVDLGNDPWGTLWTLGQGRLPFSWQDIIERPNEYMPMSGENLVRLGAQISGLKATELSLTDRLDELVRNDPALRSKGITAYAQLREQPRLLNEFELRDDVIAIRKARPIQTDWDKLRAVEQAYYRGFEQREGWLEAGVDDKGKPYRKNDWVRDIYGDLDELRGVRKLADALIERPTGGTPREPSAGQKAMQQFWATPQGERQAFLESLPDHLREFVVDNVWPKLPPRTREYLLGRATASPTPGRVAPTRRGTPTPDAAERSERATATAEAKSDRAMRTAEAKLEPPTETPNAAERRERQTEAAERRSDRATAAAERRSDRATETAEARNARSTPTPTPKPRGRSGSWLEDDEETPRRSRFRSSQQEHRRRFRNQED